jgi:hypothetical protein
VGRLAAVLIVAVLAVACGDDTRSPAVETSAPTSSSSAAPPVVGPTTSTTVAAECAQLAGRYVATARLLFEAERPTDALFEQSRAEFEELDLLAGAGGCGDAYRLAVCDGLDELTRSGTLVVYQMLTASCI